MIRSSMRAVDLVTQTRILPGKEQEFERWQQHVNEVVVHVDGYLGRNVIPPSPPVQVDWVIVQRFSSDAAARAWLASPQRQRLVGEIQPILVGRDDIHIVPEDGAVAMASPVSAVISTRVRPGQEGAFQNWHRSVAAVQATFEGFEGYKLEPPIPGVQDDWVTILRFDSDPHLQAWLTSPERSDLLAQAQSIMLETHAREIRNGFESWFTFGSQAGQNPPGWKLNMIVLLGLYPLVFLFGAWVQTPWMVDKGVPFWLALFIGNVVSVALLGYLLIPQGSRVFAWWLAPSESATRWITPAGAALIGLLYLMCLLVFSRFP